MHADLNARDSLALDLIEAVRPTVDAWLWDVISTRTFRKADFFETHEGACRLMPPLAHRVAVLAPMWAAAPAPVAEQAAHAFSASTQRQRLTTPLTQRNRRDSRPPGQRTKRHVPALTLPAACEGFGLILEAPARRYCESCQLERREQVVAQWSGSGPEALARLREAGIDPAHSEDAGRKRAERIVEQQAATKVWEQTNTAVGDSLDFARDVLPHIRTISLDRMARATGLSRGYCSFVKRGLKVPHPRHWQVLSQLAKE